MLQTAQITEGSKNKFCRIICLQDVIARKIIHAESNGFHSKFGNFANDLVFPPGISECIIWQLILPRILLAEGFSWRT
jgi:hypothetical protein